MPTLQTEGLILQATPYQDHHHIVTLFTPDYGLVRCFVRGTMRPRHHSHALVTPLTRGDFLLYQKEGGLARLQDGTITHPYLGLRDRSDRLQTACAIARALLHSQMPHKAAPDLYRLTTAYLSQIATMDSSANGLLPSFFLKLMRYEGLLALSTTCCHCELKTTTAYICGSGPYCKGCAPVEAIPFREEEWRCVKKFTELRNFSQLAELSPPPLFSQKIESLFQLLA